MAHRADDDGERAELARVGALLVNEAIQHLRSISKAEARIIFLEPE